MTDSIVSGLTTGAIYVMIALGYTLIFGIIQVIFFAQGDISMVAAFVALGVTTSLARWVHSDLSPCIVLPLALLCATAVAVGVNVVAERVALRPLRKAERIKPLITSLGVSIVLQNAVMLVVGPSSMAFPGLPAWPSWTVLGTSISLIQACLITGAIALVLLLHTFLARSRHGLAIRAAAQDDEAIRLMGIEPGRVVTWVFALAGATAAVSGFGTALYFGVLKFNMGFLPGIKGFTVAILGGVGNVRGALLAGLVLGLSESLFSTYVSSDYRDIFVFVVLVLLLALRPKGILGEGR